MSKFKVGDRVRYVGNGQALSLTTASIGRVGVVSDSMDWDERRVGVKWDDGLHHTDQPFAHNLEYETKTFEGFQVGDRVRFEANTRDTAYSNNDLPTEYNGIVGTIQRVSYYAVRVDWDIREIGNKASFTENLVVIDRPAPARKTVVVEFDAPAHENIESLVQQITGLTEVKYTIKEGN